MYVSDVAMSLTDGSSTFTLRGIHLRKPPTNGRMRARVPGNMRRICSYTARWRIRGGRKRKVIEPILPRGNDNNIKP